MHNTPHLCFDFHSQARAQSRHTGVLTDCCHGYCGCWHGALSAQTHRCPPWLLQYLVRRTSGPRLAGGPSLRGQALLLPLKSHQALTELLVHLTKSRKPAAKDGKRGERKRTRRNINERGRSLFWVKPEDFFSACKGIGGLLGWFEKMWKRRENWPRISCKCMCASVCECVLVLVHMWTLCVCKCLWLCRHAYVYVLHVCVHAHV